jgi:hypothetical protein
MKYKAMLSIGHEDAPLNSKAIPGYNVVLPLGV